MVNARRKISATGRNDVELGIDSSPPQVSTEPLVLPSENDKERRDFKAKTANLVRQQVTLADKTDLCGKVITLVIILVVLLDAYWYITPHETKVAHFKAMHDQMSSFAFSLSEQKAEIEEEIGEVNKEIEAEKSTLADYLPIVGKAHHEQEMKSLKAEYDALSQEKKDTVERMREQLKKNEELLEQLKELQSKITHDTSLFCEECKFTAQGMNTSCGNRKNYLVSNYGNKEDEAKQAVMKWDANCAKNSV